MVRSLFFASLIAFSFSASNASAEDAIALFDGNSLSGWEVRPAEGTDGHWKVEDGMIVAENKNKKGSDLWTVKPYQDFELELDYKTPSDYYDTGVFVRGSSHQVQIGISGSLQIDLTACIYAPVDGQGSYPARSDKVAEFNHPGKWNHLKITVEGKHIETFLNDEPFVKYDAVKFPREPIGLQLHQGHHMKIFFRNIKLTPR